MLARFMTFTPDNYLLLGSLLLRGKHFLRQGGVRNVPAAFAFWIAGTLASAFFCGCGENLPPAELAARESILLVNNGGEPSALDPQFAQPGVIENRIMLALFEGLVAYDPQTLAPVPAIAESWSVSADGRTWTFRLRADAKFSDGAPITSADFLFSFRRILSPKLASPCASLFFAPVKNARAFTTGTLTDFAQVGFSAPDARTLVVELESPCPYFLSLACHSSWSVVPAHAILKFGAIDERSTRWTRPENFVGSGPFRLKSWRVAYRIEVEKNPFYRDADHVALNGVRFDAVEDQFAEEKAFNDGHYHVTNTVPPSRVPALRAEASPTLRLDPYLATAFIRVNCARPPLDDPRVRRALSLALDRRALAERVMRGGETPAETLVPAAAYAACAETPNVSRTDESVPAATREREIADAQRLLAEAGFPAAKAFRKSPISSTPRTALSSSRRRFKKCGEKISASASNCAIRNTKFTARASHAATTSWHVRHGAAIILIRRRFSNFSSPEVISIGQTGTTPTTTPCSPPPRTNVFPRSANICSATPKRF